jgi:hypothetical protein
MDGRRRGGRRDDTEGKTPRERQKREDTDRKTQGREDIHRRDVQVSDPPSPSTSKCLLVIKILEHMQQKMGLIRLHSIILS